MGSRVSLSIGLGRDVDLLVWSNALWGIGNGFYTYLLPLYVAQLGASPAQIGAVLALTNVVQALVYLPAGVLAGRLGWKPLMLFGWSMGPAAMVVLWLAPSWQAVIPGIVLLAAVGWCAPAYHSYVATAAGPRDLPHAFTMMFVAVLAGATLSAPLGGWVGQVLGLRWLFVGAFLGYAASTVLVLLLRPFPGGRAPAVPLRRTGGEPTGAASEALPQPASGRRTPGRPAPGRRQALAALCTPRLLGTMAVCTALEASANLGQPLAPNWLAARFGYTPAEIGGLGSVSAAGAAVLALGLGRLQRRHGARWALAATGTALVAYAVLLLNAGAWPLAAGAYLLRGAFNVLPSLSIALVGRVLSGYGARQMSLGFGLHKSFSAAAITLTTFAAGQLFARQAPLPFLASAALLCAALGLGLVWQLLAGRTKKAKNKTTVWACPRCAGSGLSL